MMERRRKSISDLPETDPETGTSSSSMLERLRSPLLDRRALRSTPTSSTSDSVVVHLPKPHSHSRSNSSSKPPLRPPVVVEKQQPPSISRSKSVPSPPSISRSRSAPFHHRSASGISTGIPSLQRSVTRDHAPFRSSPQYRANSAVVRFDERLLPVRTNYGIAGYNTSRSRRGESRRRQGVVLRTRSRNVRVVGLGLWTRRVLVRVMRTRVRSACSRLLMRFRRPRR